VAAPCLVGLDSASAAAAATDAGLLMRVSERRTADDPSGLVLEQHPAPGAYLGEGKEVEVVVSRGPPPVVLPDVAGKPVAEAQATLTQLGFVVAVESRFDESIAKDVVLLTDPVAGGKASPESTIKLIVSGGPAPVPVPDVAGKSYDEAAQILKSKRLGASRRDDFSDSVAPGVVIGTDPPSGQPAARDAAVNVIVSKGPQLVQVPNVKGLTVEAASQKLQAVGLVPDVQNYGPGKTVRAQDPDAGASVPIHSKITLFL
jgi:serine/threonine-protein kinase